jgi:hypothetical protein
LEERDMSRAKAVMHPVTVKATKAADGSIDFRGDSAEWNGSEGHFAFHKDRHGMKKHDYHLIEFVLDDETGEGLKFASAPHDAMWVAKVDDPGRPICPDGTAASDYEVIDPMCVCDGGRRLVVRNDNPREEHYSFTLNFTKAGAQGSPEERVSWDPIIKNGNGGF